MLELNEIKQQIRKIISELDEYKYPETYAFLSKIEAEGMPAPYDFAATLTNSDTSVQMNKNVFDLVVEMLDAEIEKGNAEAMNDLGALFYAGRGCEQDFEKAVYYYKMAAENGSRQAQENLGYCYYYGRSVPVDYEKAFHYFALGAFDGHLISLYKIGDMYLNGYYVQKNEKEAFQIYDHCIALMNQETSEAVSGPVFLRLGNAFLYGKGTEVNPKNALICYQNAERFLYEMVSKGENMYKGSLQAAIDGQAKAREKLNDKIETYWIDEAKA